MTKSAYQHRPVLRRIRVLIDLLRDLLSQPRLLSKPLPSQAPNGMPADHDGAKFPVDVGLAGRYHIGFVAEAEGLLERGPALQRSLLAFFEALFSGYRVRLHFCARRCWSLVLTGIRLSYCATRSASPLLLFLPPPF